jgi:hypothetical protein
MAESQADNKSFSNIVQELLVRAREGDLVKDEASGKEVRRPADQAFKDVSNWYMSAVREYLTAMSAGNEGFYESAVEGIKKGTDKDVVEYKLEKLDEIKKSLSEQFETAKKSAQDKKQPEPSMKSFAAQELALVVKVEQAQEVETWRTWEKTN